MTLKIFKLFLPLIFVNSSCGNNTPGNTAETKYTNGILGKVSHLSEDQLAAQLEQFYPAFTFSVTDAYYWNSPVGAGRAPIEVPVFRLEIRKNGTPLEEPALICYLEEKERPWWKAETSYVIHKRQLWSTWAECEYDGQRDQFPQDFAEFKELGQLSFTVDRDS